MKKKLLVTLLSFVMVVTMMPIGVFANTANSQKGGNETIPASELQKGDTVKLPVNNESELIDAGCVDADGNVDFVVLDNNPNFETSSTGAFLVSQKTLKNMAYTSKTTPEWDGSEAQQWCKNVYSAMPTELQGNILAASKTEAATTVKNAQGSTVQVSAMTLTNENVFLLSTVETMKNTTYFANAGARIAVNAAGEGSRYYTRSIGDTTKLGSIKNDGNYANLNAPGSSAMRPALNLNGETQLEKVSDGVYKWVKGGEEPIPASELQKGDVALLPVDNTAEVVDPSEVKDGQVSFTVLAPAQTENDNSVFCVSTDVLKLGIAAQDNQEQYAGSNLQTWCHSLLSAFPSALQSNLVQTEKSDAKYTATNFVAPAQTINEKVYPLSHAELFNTAYFPTAASRNAKLGGNDCDYWTRTMGHYESGATKFGATDKIKSVNGTSLAQKNSVTSNGYRPGLNLKSDAQFVKVEDGVYKWVPGGTTMHTVTFDPNNGEETWTVDVENGQPVSKPEEDPVKEGFTFDAWQLNGVNYDFTQPVTDDITLIANYYKTADQVSVGDTIQLPVNNQGNIVDEGAIDASGYVNFKVLDKKTNNDTNGVFLISEKVLKDGVAYKTDGASSEYASSEAYTWCNSLLAAMPSALQGNIVNIIKNENEGYTPNRTSGKWQLQATTLTASGQKVFLPSAIEVNGTCNSEGGAVVPSKYFDNDAARKVVNGAGTDTTFWTRTPGISGSTICATKTRTDGSVMNGAVTMASQVGYRPSLNLQNNARLVPVEGQEGVYKWIPGGATQYTVSFAMNGHGTQVPSQRVNDGDTATEPKTPTEEGFTFEGWYSDEALASKFNFATPITKDTTLYAKWIEDKITVHLNSAIEKGATGEYTLNGEPVTEVKVMPGTTFSFSTTDPQHNYTIRFSDGQTVKVKAGYGSYINQFVVPESAEITEECAFLAEFAVEKVTVNFNATVEEGAVGGFYDASGQPIQSLDVPVGTTYTFSTTDPTKNFKIQFSTGDVVNLRAGENTTITDYGFPDVPIEVGCDFTATLSPIKTECTVTFDSMGGSEVDQVTVPYGTVIDEPEQPTKEDSNFTGWYTDKARGYRFDFSDPVKDDMTLYAGWQNTVHEEWLFNNEATGWEESFDFGNIFYANVYNGLEIAGSATEPHSYYNAGEDVTDQYAAFVNASTSINHFMGIQVPNGKLLNQVTVTGYNPDPSSPVKVVVKNYYLQEIGSCELTGEQDVHTIPIEEPTYGYVYVTFEMDTSQGSPQARISDLTADYADFTVPAVTGLTSYATGTESATIKWDQATSGDVKYYLYKSEDPKADWGEPIAVLRNSQTRYVDTDVEVGKTYYYTVRAGITVGDVTVYSPYSNVDYARPAVPAVKDFVAFAPTYDTAKVQWSKSSDPKAVYFLYKGYAPTGDWGKAKEVLGHDVTQYVDPEAETGVKAYYMVRAAVPQENGTYLFGPYTKVDYAYPRVPEITGFHAWAPNDQVANVAWDQAKDPNVVYFLYKGSQPTGDWGNAIKILPNGTRSFVDPDVTKGTKSYYMVRAAVQQEDSTYLFGPYTKVDYAWPR